MNVNERVNYVKILCGDVKCCLLEYRNSNEEHRPFWFRMLVRSFCAWIEGIVFNYKYIFIYLYSDNRSMIDVNKYLYLRELKITISKDRKSFSIKRLKMKTLDNIRNLFKFMEDIVPMPKITLGIEWNNMIDVFKSRDELMHPKSLDSLLGKHDVFLKIETSGNWLSENFVTINTSIVNCLTSRYTGDGHKPSVCKTTERPSP